MAPKLNRRRAVFVLSKIDEILAWEKAADQERDSRFVDLGRYLKRTKDPSVRLRERHLPSQVCRQKPGYASVGGFLAREFQSSESI